MAGSPADVLASGRDIPPRRVPRWVRPAAVAVLAAAVTVLALGRGDPHRDDEVAPERIDGGLLLVGDGIQVTLSGVLVLPVALSSPDTALRVRSATVTAAPVRTEPLVTTPDVVPRGGSRRLAVIVDPDCTVIGPGVGGELVATLVVRVATPSGREKELRVSLGDAPAVRSRLAGLCGTAADEAREVGLEARLDLAQTSGDAADE